jgi:rhamnogalacturonyl hydrolase YesR
MKMKNVLTTIQRIGDKLIRDTPFRYRLELAPVRTAWQNVTTEGLQFVDFGRTFGTHAPATAFAYTQMTATKASRITIEIAHTDACTAWMNGKQVYAKSGKRSATIKLDERSIEMPFSFSALLRKGTNELLIRSVTSGNKPWLVYIQPPSNHGAVIATESNPITIGLQHAPDIDAKIAALTNWLVLGPLPVKTRIVPTLSFGAMYGDTTWTIPKIDVLGNLLDPLPWGTNYHWNYHNAGVAWAMQCLAEVSRQQKYKKYADRFCDFHIDGTPFVHHQVKALNAVLCANHFIIDTPLLDFTLATALPYIYRLRNEKSFENRQAYMDYVSGILSYAQNGQVRLPGNPIYTRITPEKFTTWVDDMFMGIPFLVQASQYVPEKQKKRFMDDAAHQCLGFIKEVWDEKAQLYIHARIHGKPLRSAHWSRCNGWATWAMSEVLQVLPKNHALYAPIMKQYLSHLDCLIKWQDKDGFWTNVIDRPDSPQEVSGTAIFVMSLARAVRNGWTTDNRYCAAAIKGWEAISSKIDKDGSVYNICVGTMCSDDVDYYCSRPFYDNDTHGLFAVLFAGIEMHLLKI